MEQAGVEVVGAGGLRGVLGGIRDGRYTGPPAVRSQVPLGLRVAMAREQLSLPMLQNHHSFSVIISADNIGISNPRID